MSSTLLPSLLTLLSLLILLPCASHSTTISDKKQSMSMDPSEKDTLFHVMEAISSDANWRASYPDPCRPGSSWLGIECKPGREDSLLHVTRLNFGTPLNPTCKNTAIFPPEIFTLTHLQSIFFFNCFRTKHTTLSIPQPPATASLQQLGLKSNPALVGFIPPQISSLSSLQVLTLSQNNLTGKLPEDMSRLTSLRHLDLSYNSLTGSIPTQMGNLKNLVGLDLSYNSLTGQIPTSIGQMGLLQKLDLSSNLLTGPIPDSFRHLGSLAFMALSNNKLRGPFPDGLPELRNLQYLIMDSNPMSVELPFELGKLAKLQELRLADSEYTGPIPGSFAGLTNLTTLSLQNNRLTGQIPAGLGGLGRIYHLNLSRNMLGGVVPFDAGFFRRLGRNLDLSGNSGLCLDGDESFESIKVGVDACGGANRSASAIENRSHGAPPSLPFKLSNLLFGLLAIWGLYQSLV